MKQDQGLSLIQNQKRNTLNGPVPRLSQHISQNMQLLRKRISAREFLINRVASTASNQFGEFQIQAQQPKQNLHFEIHDHIEKYGFQPYSKQNTQQSHSRDPNTQAQLDLSERAHETKKRRQIPLKLPEPTLSGFDLDIKLANTFRGIMCKSQRVEKFPPEVKNQDCLDSTIVELLEYYPDEESTCQNQTGVLRFNNRQQEEQTQRSSRHLNLKKLLDQHSIRYAEQPKHTFTQRIQTNSSRESYEKSKIKDSHLNLKLKDTISFKYSTHQSGLQKGSINLKLRMPQNDYFQANNSTKPSPLKLNLKSVSQANMKTQASSPEKSSSYRKSVGKHFLYSLAQPH